MHLFLKIGVDPAEIVVDCSFLPGASNVVEVATLQDAQAYLQSATQQPFAILANGENQGDLGAYCRQLRAICPQEATLILLLNSPDDRATAFSSGADNVLLRPVEAAEIAAYVERAYQHSQLLVERQKIHERALENERLATIGRLTASIVHSISNPMQAMRGALILALEDSHSPRDVEEYVRLTQQELERVSRLVNRMRQLYRPPTDDIVQVHLPDLLRDAFETAQEEAMRQKVRLHDALTLDVPAIKGASSQLQLAFLSIVLSLIDIVGEGGGGEIKVSAIGTKNKVQIDFLLPTKVALPLPEANDYLSTFHYSLTPILDLIAANGGKIHFLHQEKQM